MVTVDDAGSYLRAQQLIEADAVIDGDLDIISVTRRNRNLQVTTCGSGSFLIKQPNDARTVAADTLRREAQFYSFCQSAPRAAAIRALMPRLVKADLRDSLLVLELLSDAKPLWRYYEESETADFPVAPSAAIGDALATIHKGFSDPSLLASPDLAFLDTKAPWACSLHLPIPDVLSYMSSAQLDLIRILQRLPEITRELDNLREAWLPDALIHGDIKMDNFLIVPRNGDDDGRPVIYVVDWEMVQRGDAAWDLGSAFHDFVYLWVLSMDHDKPLSEMADGARRPLSHMQPAIGALWSSYCRDSALERAAATDLLRKAVGYSAARAVQTAYEIARHFAAMPAPSVLMLQIAVNLLREPERGLAELYGMTEEGDPV